MDDLPSYKNPSEYELSQMAINFTSIQDQFIQDNVNEYPPNILFTILNHPKCRFPSKRDFINQVIDFLNNEDNIINRKEFLPLFNYIDFSIASLIQLRELSRLDEDEIYDDLNHYLKIRELEFNRSSKNQFIQSQKKYTTLNLLKYQKKYDAYQKEIKEKRITLSNVQNENDETQKELKNAKSLYDIEMSKPRQIIEKYKLDDSADSSNLSGKIQDLEKDIKKSEADIAGYKKKLKDQENEMDQIKKIAQLRKEYEDAKDQQDKLKERDKSVNTTIDSFFDFWKKYMNDHKKQDA